MNHYVNEFYLTAAEVNAQEEMPLSRLVTLIIDTATAHANSLGFGYAHMMETNTSWVLSRLSIDLTRMPGVNRRYLLVTWVDNVNRLYSDRMFQLQDGQTGEVIGWAHTTWMAIDMDSRRPTDLTVHKSLVDVIEQREFGGEKSGKLQPLRESSESYSYTFKVSDIDVNRHVTTRRYIDLITDLWPLEKYIECRVSRFEIAFKHEARYAEEAVTLKSPRPGADDVYDTEIRVGDTACALARVRFMER
ncbi:acyl-[acyl-carrier-protein] thioesterase [uncultured Duncaniella sp.]|uniref:acyl-[acyl-carrier-protein] thioesterase n=1 Tax=uncultured Duncaniella sp. TaxID=2768039 RepID=UPI0025F1ACD1|nr:acyl-ACP thioesterase domain-containing protein [uncultured Duncaniella sp.]